MIALLTSVGPQPSMTQQVHVCSRASMYIRTHTALHFAFFVQLQHGLTVWAKFVFSCIHMHAHSHIRPATNAEGSTDVVAGNKFSLVGLVQIRMCIHNACNTRAFITYAPALEVKTLKRISKEGIGEWHLPETLVRHDHRHNYGTCILCAHTPICWYIGTHADIHLQRRMPI